MSTSTLFLCASALIVSWIIFFEQAAAQQIDTDGTAAVAAPPSDRRTELYVANREPLAAAPLIRLPIGSIQPTGWLRKQLELQAAGFHGHLQAISPFLRKERNAWLDREGKGDHGWEEPPYWLKGYLNLAYVLRDNAMIKESHEWIEGAIASQKPDGWFGPDAERRGVATDLVGRDDLWPNMIMLFCLQDYYEYSGDKRIIQLMERYFKYLQSVPEDRFLIGYWPKHRGGDLLLSVYWLYNRTGERALLELAEKVHRRTAAWSTGLVDWHNVNIAQGFREPATYAMQSGSPTDRQASYDNFANIRRLYGQVPGGMFGGDENCRPGYTDPRQAIETCGMVEMMFSTETLAWITGDPLWADRCEDVAYNSLPAALTADMNALRYLTAPNMPLSDKQPKNPGLQNGGPMLLMSPHNHRCCQHNWGQGWPYFAQHQWYATSDHGLAAMFYNSCNLEAKVADGRTAKIAVETHYPFDESVRIRVVNVDRCVFPIYLRIPSWCQLPQIKINGQAIDVDAKPVNFVRLQRYWQSGDNIDVVLPMDVELKRWPENKNAVSIQRGPITYSLRIGEEYRRAGGSDRWPEWEILPTSAWNYGLVISEGNRAASFELAKREWPAADQPFTLEATPLELRAQAKRIPQWKLNEQGLVEPLPPSPVRSAEAVETVTLVPMGAARLRISAFPVIGERIPPSDSQP
jgi:DUF1680 family protein